MAAVVGKNCMVALGTTKIVGMGTWKLDGGVVTDMHDKSEFCSDFRTYLCGLKDGGTVSFSGWYNKALESAAQGQLRTANLQCECLTSLRFYLSCTTAGSYWTPETVGVSGSGHTASCIRITAWDIAADKEGIATCSFAGKIEGNMKLV